MRPCFPSFAEVCLSVAKDVDSLANAPAGALPRTAMGDEFSAAELLVRAPSLAEEFLPRTDPDPEVNATLEMPPQEYRSMDTSRSIGNQWEYTAEGSSANLSLPWAAEPSTRIHAAGNRPRATLSKR